MSSRPHPALFEATRSALLLPRPAADRIPARGDSAGFCKSNLHKSFWILRELERELALVDHRRGAARLQPVPGGNPYECSD